MVVIMAAAVAVCQTTEAAMVAALVAEAEASVGV
jgi:hypothetical protein